MQHIRKLFPGGKAKAFNVTYDDGVLQDIPFVRLLNQYGIKGTFHLNSRLMEEGFAWVHEKGLIIRRLPPDLAVSLYHGHEIASHTATHPYLAQLSEEAILAELREDKEKLEQWFGCQVHGFAVPFDFYSDRIASCVQACGFAYSRISEESRSFAPQRDYYRWRSGIFHLNDGLQDFVRNFLATDQELAICQIVGHSYDLDAENRWDMLEEIFRVISRAPDVLPMTAFDLIDYLQAMEGAQITQAGIFNPSHRDLWFGIDGRTLVVKAHQCLSWS